MAASVALLPASTTTPWCTSSRSSRRWHITYTRTHTRAWPICVYIRAYRRKREKYTSARCCFLSSRERREVGGQRSWDIFLSGHRARRGCIGVYLVYIYRTCDVWVPSGDDWDCAARRVKTDFNGIPVISSCSDEGGGGGGGCIKGLGSDAASVLYYLWQGLQPFRIVSWCVYNIPIIGIPI